MTPNRFLPNSSPLVLVYLLGKNAAREMVTGNCSDAFSPPGQSIELSMCIPLHSIMLFTTQNLSCHAERSEASLCPLR
jgi:hypothetical protein